MTGLGNRLASAVLTRRGRFLARLYQFCDQRPALTALFGAVIVGGTFGAWGGAMLIATADALARLASAL